MPSGALYCRALPWPSMLQSRPRRFNFNLSWIPRPPTHRLSGLPLQTGSAECPCGVTWCSTVTWHATDSLLMWSAE